MNTFQTANSIALATLVCGLTCGGLAAMQKPADKPAMPAVVPPPASPAGAPPSPPSTVPALTTLAPAPVASTGDRGSAYKTFRVHFDARRFSEALPAAVEVVTLSEQQFGAGDPQLITPLTNLGTTQLRLKDFEGAETSFQRALKIVETKEGGFSRDIVRPLFGLGMTYLAAGQPAEASQVLRRAVDVNRRLDGLFNVQQTELLDPLIESYAALNSQADAEREQQYALHVSELAFGKDDPRMLTPLDRGARRYEDMGRYASARTLQSRALEIVRKAHGNNDVRMVEPLRGVARAYRLEFVNGPETTEEKITTSLGAAGMGAGPQMNYQSPGLEGAGRLVLERALKILKESPTPDRALRGGVLVDLGDWYLLSGDKRRAFQAYGEAWKDLSSAGQARTQVLDEPVQLAYRGPIGSFKRPPVDIEEYDLHFVEVEFTVTQDGLVAAVATVAKDTTEAQEKSVVNAIRQARYRPRFVNGAPVAAEKVRFRQPLYLKKKKKG